MKIIDRKTGQRLDADGEVMLKTAKESDPLSRNAAKDLEAVENSPMDPPSAYNNKNKTAKELADFSIPLQGLIKEHQAIDEQLKEFEASIISLVSSNFEFSKSLDEQFVSFFAYVDDVILPYNRKTERTLFPLLHSKLVESGEHSTGSDQITTAVDLMIDDHIQCIQLSCLILNLFGLSARLTHDQRSRLLTLDVACNNAKELIELLRLQIYREFNVLFPMVEDLYTIEELATLSADLSKEK